MAFVPSGILPSATFAGPGISFFRSTSAVDVVSSIIEANGASVECDTPLLSGNILAKTTGGEAGSITITTASAPIGNIAIEAKGVLSMSSIDATPGEVAIGGPPTATGLYVSNTDLLFNGNPVGAGGLPNPMTVPNSAENNQWVPSRVYPLGAVVYSAIAPYNWFICYIPTLETDTVDPQDDVNAGAFGQGANWQLLAMEGFTTASGSNPGTFYGALTLSGSAITSTNLTTGEVVVSGGISVAAVGDGDPATFIPLTANYTLTGSKGWFSIAAGAGPFIISPSVSYPQAVPGPALELDGTGVTIVPTPDRTFSVLSTSLDTVNFVVTFV